ncbi:MAG: hypothetical protein M3082_16545 [Candidatus Dormibacteraeota bacterium]|nr:hypothetical protein [Candidatus Dormibacteraeota bacterium]
MKHLLAAVATAVLASLVSAAPGAASASTSYTVYQTERPSALGSCSTANPIVGRGQSASFSGLAVGAGILSDTICFTGPVGLSNATDTITGGSWSVSGQGLLRGTAGVFCPAGTIHWDATGLRATVIASGTLDASICGAASVAVILKGTWTRSPLTANGSTFVGTLTISR